jgi:predicted O-linked N-acetylglucosamine transferase (SPINDLY family)
MPQPASNDQRARKARLQWELGRAHAEAERWDRALRAHSRAARLAPDDAVYALNHARALMAQGDLAGASDEAWRAFQLDTGCRVARDLGVECLMRQQRFAEVVERLRQLEPESRQDPVFHSLLGLALHRMGKPVEAISAFFDGLSLGPDNAGMHYNMGICFFDLNLKQEAAQCFGTGLLLGLGGFELSARGLMCFAEREACQWAEHDEHLAALAAAAHALPAQAALPSAAFAHVAFSARRDEQLLAAASTARFGAQDIQPFASRRSDWQPGARRLRVGYLSGDFHAHATAFLMAQMLEQHDRSRFEVTLYSYGPADDSAMRSRIEAAGEHFVELRGLSDLDIAQRIRADGIDLLVDLKGHTAKSRFPIFAWRPAPLQISFLGYPGTTGAGWIDYVIGDRIVTPLDHAPDYTEKIAQLPGCYQPNDRQRRIPQPPSRASQGLPEDALVLCCFNQSYKFSPEVFDSWCRLLRELPHSVLWVLEWNATVLANLKREAAARGVDPARLIGSPRVGSDAHLDRLALADLFLDTWPYNAHTTASDALWAGVPVVSLVGETFASRVGASLLSAVGLPELACPDLATYEATVRVLANDARCRAGLSAHLQQTRDSAPLFDGARFASDIEILYLRMATRHAEGLAPAHLPALA